MFSSQPITSFAIEHVHIHLYAPLDIVIHKDDVKLLNSLNQLGLLYHKILLKDTCIDS